MTLHTTYVFTFSGKRQSQKQLPSTVTIPDSIPVSSQGTSESDQFPDSIPVFSQGTSEEFEDSIPVSSQGISIDNYFRIRFLHPARAYLLTTISGFDSGIQPGHVCEQPFPDSIPVSSQGTSEEFEDSIPVSSQGISVDDYFQTRFLYPARAYLLTTISRFDSCIQPRHIC